MNLQTTFRTLSQTPNEAAISVLIPALDSPHAAVRDGALRAILERHSPAGQRELVRRLHLFDEGWQAIIDERHERLTDALRDALLAPDRQLSANGCAGVLRFREFDLMPTVINAAEDEANPNRERLAATLLKLAEALYDELATPRDYRHRRDSQIVRQHVIAALEQSVLRHSKHHRQEPLEAFLLLVHRENATLKQILLDPLHPSYLPLVNLLTHSQRPGVIRLALSFLDDPHPPSMTLALLSHRSDARFFECVLRKIGLEPSAVVAQNLKRVESIPALQGDRAALDRLDEAAQHAAVRLTVRSGMNRLAAFEVIEHLLTHGKPGGRRAAAQALAQFNGAEANALALSALEDPDPQTQAHALSQLRRRGIPGALTRLIAAVDSPHEIVRQAAREALAEFSFRRFLAAYDVMEEEVRRSTGAMVPKIDPETVPLLVEELTVRSRTRRLRAVAMTVTLELAPAVQAQLIALLGDEDHMVRADAARALSACDTPETRQALRGALNDRSPSVQDAVVRSLRRLAPDEAPHTIGAS